MTSLSRKISDPSHFYSLIGMILGSAFIGASPIFVRYSTVDPFATGFFRFFFALPFLWAWTILEGVKKKREIHHPKESKDYFLLAMAGVFFALDIAFWHHSLHHTSVVNSTLLNSMTPIFVTLISWAFLKDKLSWLSLAGVSLALGGTCLLVLSDGKLGEFKLFGDSLALLSAFFFSGYVFIVKHLRGYFSAPTVMAWTSMSCMYCLALLTFYSEQNIIPLQAQEWMPLVGLALVVHTLGQGLIAFSLKRLSAVFSSITMMLTPVVSAILAWILFEESFTELKILGAFIIIAGIILARQNEK